MDSQEPGGPPASEIVFYQEEDGRSRVQVRLDGGIVWLTQRLLGELFQKDLRTISEHIRNIFDDGEPDPRVTIRKFRIVQTEGKREVARHRGTQFRRWATERLSEYVPARRELVGVSTAPPPSVRPYAGRHGPDQATAL